MFNSFFAFSPRIRLFSPSDSEDADVRSATLCLWSLHGLSVPKRTRSAPTARTIETKSSSPSISSSSSEYLPSPSMGVSLPREKEVSIYAEVSAIFSATSSQFLQPPMCASTRVTGPASESARRHITGEQRTTPGKPMSSPE